MKGIAVITLFVSVALVSCDVSHILVDDVEPSTPPPPPPRPYLFSYTAGRFPGHNDRAHTEVSDGKGTVRGAYSFIDPAQNIRSVEYVADKDGFRPVLSHPLPAPKQSEAVQLATRNHINLYNRIAEEHAHPELNAAVPRDSASVAYAKQKHQNLFESIAAEHARIGAEQEVLRAELEAKRTLFESTSELTPDQLEARGGHIPVAIRHDY